MSAPGAIEATWLGRKEYAEALRLQEQLVAQRDAERLLLLEHEPVYTTGRSGNPGNRPDPRGAFGSVPFLPIGRGGDATYHGPGQLVGYVLVDLASRGGDVGAFLRAIEQGVIDLLAIHGIAGGRVPGRTGVWVGQGARGPATDGTGGPAGEPPPRKIAAIGIGVRRGWTLHGFALNVSVDLGAFAAIVPCGIEGVVTTSLAAEGVRPVPTVEDVARDAARVVPRALEAALSRSSRRGTEAR